MVEKIMTDERRDILLTEMHTDIKWLKEFNIEHKKEHGRYIFYFITTAIAIIASWFR
jgi:hypothetical protein